MGKIAIVGTGFMADRTMRAAAAFPDVRVVGAWDEDPERLRRFAAHWDVPAARSLEDLFTGPKRPHLLLNLTPPGSHYTVSRAALEASLPVLGAAPLATSLQEARDLVDVSARRGVPVGAGPSTVLAPSGQALAAAVRRRLVGRPRLVTAEADQGFLAQAPHCGWVSESGARWNAAGRFAAGPTFEAMPNALSWLLTLFGPVRTVIAASACLDEPVSGNAPWSPDWATALLFFDDGVAARLSTSRLARRNNEIRIVGERGTLVVDDATAEWAGVRIERRSSVRGRLVEGVIRERVRVGEPPWRRRWRPVQAPVAPMLGVLEMLEAVEEARPPRLAGDFALHLSEVTLAIREAGRTTGPQTIQSTFEPVAPMPWAKRRPRREDTVETINVGIVGTGRMAALLREAALSEPRLEVTSVAAATIEEAETFAADEEIELAYDDPAKMMRGGVDAIIVAGPPAGRAAASIEALKAGKPVLAATPFAVSRQEAEAVVAAAREAGVPFLEGLWTPFLPAHRRALELARGGTLGEPVHLSADHGHPATADTEPEAFGPGGGVLRHRMVHPLALALALFGEPEEIDRAVSADGGVDVRASLLLRHRGGAVSQLSASLTTLMSNAARLAMTGGSIRVEDPLIAAETVTVRRVAPPEAAPERQVTAPSPGAAAREQLASRLRRSGVARRVGRAVTAPPAETRSYGATPFLPLVSHFATLVTERRSESEILPPALSLTLSRLIAEAMEPDAALVADSTEAAV